MGVGGGGASEVSCYDRNFYLCFTRAYGEEVLLSLQEKVVTGLENLKNQPVESEKYGNLETGRRKEADLHI